MFRLIGILTGSAIAIVLLIVAIGLPSLTPPAREPTAEIPVLPQAAATTEAEVQTTPQTDAPPDVAAEPQGVETGHEAADAEPDAELETVVDEIFAPREPVEENWYAFWSPFRSEIAANGFIARLQEKTGIDYRVVKVKTGVYEVAFAYTDDADIAAKLDRITMATGLDMSGG